MKKRQATIKDIAKALGIAASTVSRALKGHPKISKATREKVLELAAELHYKPNRVALNLKNQQTGTIGVIIPDFVHHFFATVISGIEDIAYANGYSVMFCQSNESYEREVLDMQVLIDNGVDGLLISHSRETTNFDHFEEVISQNIPIVFFDRVPLEVNAPKIIINDFESAKEATQHLIDQSCQRVIHMTGAMNLQISQKRKEGFLAALKENNLPVYEESIIDCIRCEKEMGYQYMKEILQQGQNSDSDKEIGKENDVTKKRPDGVFANNDLMAYGVMEAIKEAGLRIPEDIAVIGFSNWNFSSLIAPQLSSIDQRGVDMGKTAISTLLDLIKNDQPGEDVMKVLTGKLIARESSVRKIVLKA